MQQPYWHEGLFLEPIHLRLMHDGLEKSLVHQIQNHIPFHWGFSELVFDSAALAQGQVGLQHVSCCFPDGTAYAAREDHILPPRLNIPSDTQNAPVYLCVTHAPFDGRDATQHAGTHSGTARYLTSTKQYYDAQSNENLDVEMQYLHVTLSLTQPANAATLPIAWIKSCTHGEVALDQLFIPPLLSWKASSYLLQAVREIAVRLQRRGAEFSQHAATRQPNSSDALQAFLTLLALNTHAAVMLHTAHVPSHPECLFRELLRLIGSLSAFTRSAQLPALPDYDHNHLRDVFPCVFDLLYRILAQINPSVGAVMIDLERSSPRRYDAVLPNPDLLKTATFILVARAAVPAGTLKEILPARLKIASSAAIDACISLSFSATPLSHLDKPPAQVPAYAGYSVFGLDQTSLAWAAICESQSLSLQSHDDLSGCVFELWAIPKQDAA